MKFFHRRSLQSLGEAGEATTELKAVLGLDPINSEATHLLGDQ